MSGILESLPFDNSFSNIDSSSKKQSSKEVIAYGLYSGSDITVYAVLPSASGHDKLFFKELPEIETLSYSVYRNKRMVYGLGNAAPKGSVRGSITIAGTIVFTVRYNRVLDDLLYEYEDIFNSSSHPKKFMRIDQLPPLTLYVEMHNEYGKASRMAIFGVEFLNEGQVMSVADLIIENSVNYIARDITPLEEYVNEGTLITEVKEHMNNINLTPGASFDQLLKEAEEEIKQRRRLWL